MIDSYDFKPFSKSSVGGGWNAAVICNDGNCFEEMVWSKVEFPHIHVEREPIKKVPPSFDKVGFCRAHIDIGMNEAQKKADALRKEEKRTQKEEEKRVSDSEKYKKYAGKIKNYERIIRESISKTERETARKLYKAIAGREYSGPEYVEEKVSY